MAHLPPNAAIFSPSVARAAASAAKDWSYVDSWLQRKFPGRGPPSFERNADTLRALLALASANEAADEERALVARLEAEALEQLRAHEQPHGHDESGNQTDTGAGAGVSSDVLPSAREAILTSLEEALPRDGQVALAAMASLALQTHTPLPTPSALGAELVSLTAQSFALEQTISRIETLTEYMTREAAATARLSAELRPPSPHQRPDEEDDEDDENHPTTTIKQTPNKKTTGYHPPADLSLQNLSLQRHIKALSTRVPELRDKAAALARSAGGTGNGGTPSPTIQQVRAEEEAYLALLAEKKALDGEVRAFQGLPPDAERAREELEALRAELRRLTLRRDEVFEELVERETPRKGKGHAQGRR